jgi:biopolymer transport protein ExbD
VKLRSDSRAEPEINLTSLIDVVLLLLVFFMITTSFVRESQLAIQLPESSADAVGRSETPPLEITVTARGDYLVNGRGLVDNSPATLRAALRQSLPDEASLAELTISADARASHQSVVTAMDVAGKLGFTNISIATLRAVEQGD